MTLCCYAAQTAWTNRSTNLTGVPPGGMSTRRRCHVFSFGINDDPSFDVEIALSWGCVRAIDPNTAMVHARG